MDPPDRIFRQAALDRLSSPEQLDQLMQVTTPKSWMALVAFGVLLLTALVWGIFGQIPTRVAGRGIFIKSEGVFVVAARGEGNVIELLAHRGDTVTNGQLLARISQPEIEIKRRQAETNLEGLQESLRDLVRNQEREESLETGDLAAQKSMYERTISNYSAQVTALIARTNVQQELLAEGLISKVQFLDTQNALYAAQYDLYHTQVQLQQLDIERFKAQAAHRQLRADREDQIREAQNQVEYLSSMYALNTEVRSPYEGDVLEVRVKQGDLITANTAIATLQSAANLLEARLYLNAADGKLLNARFQRMRRKRATGAESPNIPLKPVEVLLAPVSVKKEEYGLLRGTVEDVSDYPVTTEGMLRILENPTLVAEFSQIGAPIEVRVLLEKSAETPSGFVWTSADGPPTRITSGTLCEGTITIDHQSPISLMLPFLNRKTKN
jgi:HlyD family secretion protein